MKKCSPTTRSLTLHGNNKCVEFFNTTAHALIEKFGGGPVGMNTLATAIGENAGTLEEVYEPFLIQEGLLVRTPRGRQATRAAFDHLGLTPNAASGNLFE